MLTSPDHFAHRESDGIVVDLFWTRERLVDEFRVEVKDDRERTRFVLRPRTGRAALRAFYNPFAALLLEAGFEGVGRRRASRGPRPLSS